MSTGSTTSSRRASLRRLSSPDALFLAPPHSHDPTDVSDVAALPTSMLLQLPEAVQESLWTLQESTSIVYASYLRLQELVEERFERLVELPFGQETGIVNYSEGAFFNYVNHVAAERRYLLEDAHTDWRHKASRAGLQQYGDLSLVFRGKEMTVSQWFTRLQAAEAFWIQAAKETELPDFESTVLEFQSQTTTPSSESADEIEDVGGVAVPAGRATVDTSRLGLGISQALAEL
ncbi:hypothetical protein PV08_10139 [Exophiala spinifera]|uniref:Uncharacterized protein n=1 Tax=Exophiala spinifera TaxID=91928 RepID=A0A0D2AWH6_9EURO|nr:uncharacterized protein PV08_10139 [Exophiala spinifera]KIW10840.1 hypothetical protein PV08_10139 [Exophiala spinifera]